MNLNITSNEYARLLGATFFEKHITLVQGEERVDYNSAVGPDTIKKMTDRIRFIEDHVLSAEEDSFKFHETEVVYRNRQLVCVATRDIEAGSELSESDISLKMMDASDTNLYRVAALIGKTIRNAVAIDMPIQLQNIADE